MRTRILFLLLIASISTVATAATRRRAISPDRCSVVVSPASLSFAATGGQQVVTVNVSGANCPWSPVSNQSWASGSPGSNSVTVIVAANAAESPRSAIIHVRGAIINVTQAANSQPNMLTNGGFDTNTSNWSSQFSGAGSAQVGSTSPIISPGPSANAVRIVAQQTSPGFQLAQCVAVIGGKSYDSGIKVLIPTGQPSDGVVNFALYEYHVPGCDTSKPYFKNTILSRGAPVGTWFDLKITENTDQDTQSILVVFGAGGTRTPPFTAWFDDVYFREQK